MGSRRPGRPVASARTLQPGAPAAAAPTAATRVGLCRAPPPRAAPSAAKAEVEGRSRNQQPNPQKAPPPTMTAPQTQAPFVLSTPHPHPPLQGMFTEDLEMTVLQPQPGQMATKRALLLPGGRTGVGPHLGGGAGVAVWGCHPGSSTQSPATPTAHLAVSQGHPRGWPILHPGGLWQPRDW